jgi:hypothetical protein
MCATPYPLKSRACGSISAHGGFTAEAQQVKFFPVVESRVKALEKELLKGSSLEKTRELLV